MSRYEIELPTHLHRDAQACVAAGWHKSLDELIAVAMRRYLETHAEAVARLFVGEVISWGLRGSGQDNYPR